LAYLKFRRNPLRILFLTHRLPYAPNRGDRIRSYYELQFLAKHAEVHVVSLVHDREEEAHAEDLRQVAASVTVLPVPKLRGYRRAAAALCSGQPVTHALLDTPGIKPAISHRIRNTPPDVVFAYCSGMARFAVEPPLLGTPFVLDMVDVDSEKWRELSRTARHSRRWIYAREQRTLSTFEAHAVRQAHATLVVNERERKALLDLAPGAKVYVVQNGIDIEGFRPNNGPSTEPTVVFCGVMNYSPNEMGAIWLAKEVWPIVRRHRPDARLLIVGSAPTGAVRALAAADASIEVTGSVADVRPYLWHSAVSVAPLKTSRGVQNKVLEAIAAGLPAVVTAPVYEGLPAEVAGACTVADAPERFADGICRLLDRPASERRATAERADLTPLTWSKCLAPMLALVEGAARDRTFQIASSAR
jgi:sugar transferase (PEP-CTERM/EpsH1 system associated)